MNDNRVYANKITKKFKNNEEVYYGASKESVKPKFEKSVRQKINDIFSSRNYVYKADVFIKTKDSNLEKTIIGRNREYLITSSGELILIKDILDINKKQS